MDQNIVEIIDGLSALQERIRQEGVDKVQGEIVQYFQVNNWLLNEALRVYDTISESRREELQRTYRELDRTAVEMDFSKFARMPLDNARLIESDPSYGRFVTITDDNLHMLKRALEFVKYVTNSRDTQTL